MLHRHSGTHGYCDISGTLAPMPSHSGVKPGDYTGDAHKKNRARARRDRQIRGLKSTQYVGTIQSPLVNADDLKGYVPEVKAPERPGLFNQIVAACAAGTMHPKDIADDRTRRRVERILAKQ